jgi:hypothetical protein
MNKNNVFKNIILLLFFGVFTYFAYSILNIVETSTEMTIAPINKLSTEAADFFNPTPTFLPDPITIIHEIRSLARLETIQFSMEKLITAEIGQGSFGFLFGDKLLFVAHGEVIAGIDLNKLTPEDLRVEGGVLYVQLPEAEVFVSNLDNDKSYVYDRETGILTKGNVDLESEARSIAENEILKAALEDGILIQAQINGENYLTRLFRNLGFDDVIFVTAED